MLGWTEQELLSRPFYEFVHPDDLTILGSSIQEMAAEPAEVTNQDIRVLSKDGSYRWLAGNYCPVFEDGLMYGMAVDVTERKEAEEALRQSERRIGPIIDAAYEAFISIDDEGRIVEWNAEAERVFAWRRDEALGRLLGDTIIPERYRTDHVEGMARYRATGDGRLVGRRIEIEALRRDGSEFPVELTISPTRLDNRVVFNAFLRDISERRRFAWSTTPSPPRKREPRPTLGPVRQGRLPESLIGSWALVGQARRVAAQLGGRWVAP